jgi:polygalacturonase
VPVPSPTPSSSYGHVIPVRTRGTTVINAVTQYAADNTGKTDTTARIQAAINALPVDGGTVYLPAGTYLINTVPGIQLRSKMLFDMDSNAVLKAIANNQHHYHILQATSRSDVEIRGGQLVGDRDAHTYTVIYLSDGVTKSSLSTHEWGHCIGIGGCTRVTVSNVRMSNGTGDGMSVGATTGANWVRSTDIVVYNVIANNNRRQGLSITNVDGMKVYDSQFLNTNGTSPQCGIDIEPDSDANSDGTGGTDAGTCSNVLIEGCTIAGNTSYGLNVFLRVFDTIVRNNHFYQNKSCGAVAVDPTRIQFLGNLFEENAATGLFMKAGVVGGVVSDNVFSLNYSKQSPTLRSKPLVVKGVVSGTARDILVSTGSDTLVNTNTYK